MTQMPGWSGLANARVTMFGDVYELTDDLQRGAREVCVAFPRCGRVSVFLAAA